MVVVTVFEKCLLVRVLVSVAVEVIVTFDGVVVMVRVNLADGNVTVVALIV